MKTHTRILSAALLALSLTTSADPVQLSIWAPGLQLRPAEADIQGLRLDIYGKNHNVTGLDLGFVGVSTGDVNGLSEQYIYNYIVGDAYGWIGGMILHVGGEGCGVEGGLVALFDKDFTGLAGGLYSEIGGALTGVQLGFLNRCNELHGVQLGFVNMAKTGRGLQLGLVNIFDEGFCPVFPFVNFHF